MLQLNSIDSNNCFHVDPKQIVFVSEQRHDDSIISSLYLESSVDGQDVLQVAHSEESILAMIKRAS